MGSKIAFGYKCPTCCSSFEVAVLNQLICHQCNVALIPNLQSQGTKTMSTCSKCGSAFGMVIGSPDSCPSCNQTW